MDISDKARALIIALESTLYIIPQTNTLMVYISKLDTSGHHSPGSTPPTSLLTRSFLSYYFNPATRPVEYATLSNVWVQLFARAPPLMEQQYLFRGSGEWEGKKKRWRGDRGLCGWWRGVLGRVVDEVGDKVAGRYYLLPGYTKEEAEDALRSTPASDGWSYGHPYKDDRIRLPCPYEAENAKNLGRYIPYFEDCPKSRFMDEIGYATEGESKRKKRKTDGDEKEEEEALGEMSRVSVDEFWERMSFRQECVSGAITGFFSIFVVSEATAGVSPLAPQPGQVACQINKRVLTTLLTGVEFTDEEKAVKATEMVEGMIQSLCQGKIVFKRKRDKTPERQATLTVPQTPPPRHGHVPDVSPNPFPEPIATPETYDAYIYGSVSVKNPEKDVVAQGVAPIKQLVVRKKKKT